MEFIASNRKHQTIKVHKIVAHCFIGLRPDGLVIDHKDRNRGNNHEDNLHYVTVSDNNI